MRNEYDASSSGNRKAIDYPIDLPDRSPDLNIRSGASIALWIAFDDSALQERMSNCATYTGRVEACTASTSARRATRAGIRLQSQSYTTNTGVTWRCAASTPRPLRPLAVARAPTEAPRQGRSLC